MPCSRRSTSSSRSCHGEHWRSQVLVRQDGDCWPLRKKKVLVRGYRTGPLNFWLYQFWLYQLWLVPELVNSDCLRECFPAFSAASSGSTPPWRPRAWSSSRTWPGACTSSRPSPSSPRPSLTLKRTRWTLYAAEVKTVLLATTFTESYTECGIFLTHGSTSGLLLNMISMVRCHGLISSSCTGTP